MCAKLALMPIRRTMHVFCGERRSGREIFTLGDYLMRLGQTARENANFFRIFCQLDQSSGEILISSQIYSYDAIIFIR